jgi:pre-mRNA-processing factor SLU7
MYKTHLFIYYYCYFKEHLEALPKELLLAQSENYVEYNRKGKVVKGADHTMLKSRYDEDVSVV